MHVPKEPGSARRGLPWRQLAPPLILIALIFASSSRSSAGAPPIPGIDKLVHFAVYGLLATLVCRIGPGWRAAAFAILVASTYGALDEWHQSFVPGRSSEVMDWVADTSGAMLGVFAYTRWHGYRLWLEQPCRLPRRKQPPTGAPDRLTPDQRPGLD